MNVDSPSTKCPRCRRVTCAHVYCSSYSVSFVVTLNAVHSVRFGSICRIRCATHAGSLSPTWSYVWVWVCVAGSPRDTPALWPVRSYDMCERRRRADIRSGTFSQCGPLVVTLILCNALNAPPFINVPATIWRPERRLVIVLCRRINRCLLSTGRPTNRSSVTGLGGHRPLSSTCRLAEVKAIG